MSPQKTGHTQDIRWKQRFENFNNAFNLLQEAVELGLENLSDLEKEGMMQRFEVVFELSWKILKDYLEYAGQNISPLTPRNVVKEAFSAGIIPDGQVWIEMLDHRNLLSHTYGDSFLNEIAEAIEKRYSTSLSELRNWFRGRLGEE